jgi:hypothetical protein
MEKEPAGLILGLLLVTFGWGLHASVVPFVVLCPYLYWYCQLMLEVGESLGDVPRRH